MNNPTKYSLKNKLVAIGVASVMLCGGGALAVASGASAATAGGPAAFIPVDNSFTLLAGTRKVNEFSSNDKPNINLDANATYFFAESDPEKKVKLGETLTTPNASYTLTLDKNGNLANSSFAFKRSSGADVQESIKAFTQNDEGTANGIQTLTMTIKAHDGDVGTVSTPRNEFLQVPMNSGKANFDVTDFGDAPVAGVKWDLDSFKVYGGDVSHENRTDSVTNEVGSVTTEIIDGKVTGAFTPAKDYFGAGSAIIQGQDEDGNLYTTTLTIDVTKVELGEPPVNPEVPVVVPEEETPVVVPEEETPVKEVPVVTPEEKPEVPVAPVTPEEVPVAPEVPVVTPQNVTPVVTPDVTATNNVDTGLKDTLAETGANNATQVGVMAGIGILIVGLIALAFGKFAPKRKRNSVADIAGNDDTETTFHTVTKPEKDIDAPEYD